MKTAQQPISSTNTRQSESDNPWTADVLEYLREQKATQLIYFFVPISFISEHIEVLLITMGML